MFTLLVWFGSSQTPWAFLYNEEDKARDQFNLWATGLGTTCEFIDDHGQHLIVNRKDVFGVLLEDLKKSAEAKIQLSMHQQRTQQQYQSRMQADPVLRFNGGGVPVFDPTRIGRN